MSTSMGADIGVFGLVKIFAEEICRITPPRKPEMLPLNRTQAAVHQLDRHLDDFKRSITLAEQTDAALNLVYFASMYLHEMGVNSRLGFDILHQANMRMSATDHVPVRPSIWRPPDLAPALWRPKILVLGYGGHGKDEFCYLLKYRHGLAYKSTSLITAERIMIPYFESIGIRYDSAEACFADRRQHRRTWYEEIGNFNKHDASAFARLVLATNDIYCGMRAFREIDACQRLNLFDAVVWVDRSKHVAPEPSDSQDIGQTIVGIPHVRIDNNGSLADLALQTDRLIREVNRV